MKKFLLLFFAFFAMTFLAKAQVVVFSENFDSGIPTNWSQIDANNDGYGWLSSVVSLSTVLGHNDSPGFAFSQSYNNNIGAIEPDNWLITPVINLTEDATLTFYVCAQDAAYPEEHYGVYITNSDEYMVTSNYILLFEETIDENGGSRTQGTWKMKTFDLSEYTGETVHIAFRHFDCEDWFYLNLDDVEISIETSDPIITVSPGALSMSALVNTTANATVTVGAYNLTAGITVSTTAPFAVSSDGTSYGTTATIDQDGGTLYVQYAPTEGGTEEGTITLSSAGATNVEITVTGSAVDCSNAPWPYSCDFEDESQLDCWTIVDVDNNGVDDEGYIYGGISYVTLSGGNNVALYLYDSDVAANDWLISPIFSIPENGAIASFDFMASSSYPERFSVYVIPAGETYNTATEVIPTRTVGSDAWETQYIDLTAYAGNSVQIGIKVESEEDMNYLYIDNFFIGDELPAEIEISPRRISMGNVIVGQTPHAQFVIGSTSLNEDIILTTEDPYSISYNGGEYSTMVTIPANSEFEVYDTVLVQFAPVDTGNFVGTIYIEAGELMDSVVFVAYAYECEAISEVSRTWGFESPNIGGTTSYPLPACWGRLGNTTYPYTYNSSYYAHTGNYSLYSYNSSNYIAVLPEIDTETLPINTLQLNFYAMCTSSTSGTIEIGVMTDPTDATTFAVVSSVSVSNGLGTSYAEFEKPLGSYEGDGNYIALRFTSTGSIYVDDVTLELMSNCLKPSSITVSEVTSNSITLNWEQEGTVASWNVAYGPSPLTIGDGTAIEPVTEGTPTVTIDDLDFGQSYDFYVQAVCDDGESSWRGPISATPGAFTFGIEGSSTITACNIILYDNGGPDGNYEANCNYTLTIYPSDPDSVVSISGTYDIENSYDHLYIYEGTSATGTYLANLSGTGNIGPFTSEMGPLTLKFTSDGSVVKSGFEAIVSCAAAPDCRAPYGLAVNNITAEEATVTWTADEDATIELYYKEHSNTVYVTVTADEFTGNSYTMEELTPATSYDVYVATLCDDDTLETSVLTFTTPCLTTIVDGDNPFMEDFNTLTEGIPVCWDNSEGTTTTALYKWNYYATGETGACVRFNSFSNTRNNTNMLKTPVLDLSALTTPMLGFSYKNPTGGDFSVYLSTDGGATYTTALATGLTGASAWTEAEYLLSNLTDNENVVIVFKGTSNYGYDDAYIYLDNVFVGEAPTCIKPAEVNVVNISSGEAVVTWPLVENVTWEVAYDTTGFDISSDEVIPESTPDTFFIMQDLQPNTSYDVYVRTVCDDGHSLWVMSTFRTQCEAFDSYPFVETFDPASTTRDCWSVIDANNDGKTFAYYSYDQCMYYPYHGSNAANDWLISPVFVLDGAQIADFDYWSSSWEERFQVFAIAADGTETALTQIISVQTSTHQNLLLDLSDLTGEYQIGIHCVSAANKLNLYVDNFRVRSANDPELTAAPATLSFAGEVGLASDAQTVNISSMALTEDITVTVDAPFEVSLNNTTGFATTLTIPVSGLMFDTTVYVRYNPTAAGEDAGTITLASSGVTATVTLTGSAADCTTPLALPHTEDFESYAGTTYSTPGVVPNCWVAYGNYSGVAPHITSTGDYHYTNSGTNCMVFTSNNSSPNAYAALPAFTSPLNSLKITFWRAMESATSGTLTVGYVTDRNNLASSFVEVETVPSISHSSATATDTFSVDFAAAANIPTDGYICFRWYKDGTYYSCCIDDIYVEESTAPIIEDPTVATYPATGIAQTTATLNGAIVTTGDLPISGCGFEWKANTASEYTVVNLSSTAATLTHNLTGLNANTDYTYRAFATTANGTFYGEDVNFRTLEEGVDPCDAPTNLQVTNITQNTATMTWTPGGGETSWQVGYKTQSASQWTDVPATTTSYNLEGLSANTTYNVRVRAICENNESDYVTSSFTTEGVGIDNITLANSISLQPNPADNYIELSINSNVEVKEAVIYNAFGQKIQTVELNNNHARIDLDNMAAGMYFVRVNGDNTTATKKFIKK